MQTESHGNADLPQGGKKQSLTLMRLMMRVGKPKLRFRSCHETRARFASSVAVRSLAVRTVFTASSGCAETSYVKLRCAAMYQA